VAKNAQVATKVPHRARVGFLETTQKSLLIHIPAADGRRIAE
jgi:hypothetical protein